VNRSRSDGGTDRVLTDWFGTGFDVEELRRRNPNAVAMDVLYLLTTSFFAHLAVRGFWPVVIAAAPVATLLYFGLRSSLSFFVAQLLVIVLTVVASAAGLVPL